MGENSKSLRRLERGARAEAYLALPRKSARGFACVRVSRVSSARKLERSSGCRAELTRETHTHFNPRARGGPAVLTTPTDHLASPR